MPPRQTLSRAETEIARLVWELKSATVRQVCDALPADRHLEFTTVQTYLRRLEEKGYLKVRLDNRTRVYSPRVRPGTVVKQTVNDVVDRLFGGDAVPLVRHLVEERTYSADEIAQLKDLIGRLEADPDQ